MLGILVGQFVVVEEVDGVGGEALGGNYVYRVRETQVMGRVIARHPRKCEVYLLAVKGCTVQVVGMVGVFWNAEGIQIALDGSRDDDD